MTSLAGFDAKLMGLIRAELGGGVGVGVVSNLALTTETNPIVF